MVTKHIETDDRESWMDLNYKVKFPYNTLFFPEMLTAAIDHGEPAVNLNSSRCFVVLLAVILA